MEAQHIHLGPGKLGLGLILDIANQAGLDTHLVARPDSSAAVRKYALELTDHGQRPLRFASYSEVRRSYEELEDEAKEAITSDAPLLITTALGQGLKDRAPLLVEIGARRQDASAPTLFVACENHLGPAYESLAARLVELGVECRHAMVNRLCPEARREPEAGLVTRADPYAEWVVEGSSGEAALADLEDIDYVAVVADAKPFSARKLWLVNGVHQALGIFARKVNEPSIRTAARDFTRNGQVAKLQADIVEALPEDWHAVLGDSVAYAAEQLVPICRTEDDVSRILSKLSRADPAPFLEDANRKLAEPARRHASANGGLTRRFHDVFAVLHQVLLHIDQYTDAIAVKSGLVSLSEENDRAAVSAYASLMDGVVEGRLRATRRDQLAQRLRRHHLEVLGGS